VVRGDGHGGSEAATPQQIHRLLKSSGPSVSSHRPSPYAGWRAAVEAMLGRWTT
jgi:hypothetical protein